MHSLDRKSCRFTACAFVPRRIYASPKNEKRGARPGPPQRTFLYIYIHMYACLSPGWTVVSLSSDSLPILPRGLRQPGLPEPHSHRSQSATSLHVNSSGDDRQVWVLGFTLAVLPWKSNLRRSGRRLWHLGNPQQ